MNGTFTGTSNFSLTNPGDKPKLTHHGCWNALINSPELASSSGNKGDIYFVAVPGTTNLDGITDWQLEDWLLFDGNVWIKADKTKVSISYEEEF